MEPNTVLEQHPLFSGLKRRQVSKLIKLMQPVHLAMGEILFHQNDKSNALYFVITGRLQTSFVNPAGKHQLLNKIKSGQVIGDLAVLSGKVYSSTVVARQQSYLMKLARKDFESFSTDNPQFMRQLVQHIALRAQDTLDHLREGHGQCSHLALLPLYEGIDYSALTQELMEQDKQQKCRLLHSEELASWEHKDLCRILTEVELATTCLVTDLQSLSHSRRKIVLESADRVYIIAPAKELPDVKQLLRPFFSFLNGRSCELILLQPHNGPYKNTTQWYQRYPFQHHHHVNLNDKKHCQRMSRLIIGCATGLVLSGGGSRCWAHMGALTALIEQNIEIDCIAGTSAGAAAAAAFCLAQNEEKREAIFKNLSDAVIKKSIRWRDMTLPVVSVFNGAHVTRMMKRMFHDIYIEDLPINYFATVGNLAKGAGEYINRGELWHWLRATCSIPGLYAPVVDNGQLFVDGGMCDNLPIVPMRQLVGRRGTVIAIDVSSTLACDEGYDFPPVLTFFDVLMRKLRLRKNYRTPKFYDLMTGILFLSQYQMYQNNCQLADMLIQPGVGSYGMFDKRTEEIKQLGYQTTKDLLTK